MDVLDLHVFVGSEVGLLKGVNIEKGSFTNLNPLVGLSKEDEITSMCWQDSTENKVCIGRRNQTVQIYDYDSKVFHVPHNVSAGEGPIKGLGIYNDNIITAVESGIVSLWNNKMEKCLEINSEGNLCKMTVNPYEPSHIATGGEENDLKIWDLQNPLSPIFKAKNVRNDFLDLRVPVWIMDAKFRADGKIVTCTRHHQIRLYDPKAQRRPVIDMNFERYPLMSLSLAHNEHQIVVGSSRGRMALVDLRRKLLVHVFKGFAGSIRCVQCHPSLPLVASCGLDRFLRIHDLNQHKLLKKIYLKTRLNCLLMKTAINDIKEQASTVTAKKLETAVIDDEEEKIWKDMEVVKGNSEKKKKNFTENLLENASYKKRKIQKVNL